MTQQEDRIRNYFRISVLIKGIISFAEIVGGIAVFFVPVSSIAAFVMRLAQGELTEQPNDIIATYSVHLVQQFSIAGGTFIAIFLLSRGLIKLGLVIALLKNQLWAYPISLVVLGLFVLYQLYQIAVAFSVLLVLLTVFDLVVMWFIWREYQVLRAHTLSHTN